MKRVLRVLHALVAGRTVILIVLGLFYVLSVFLVVFVKPAGKGAVVGLLSIIPTAGFFAIATERAIQYAHAGALLGISDHATAVRQGQIGVATLFLLTPVVVGACLGGPLPWLLLLCVPAALGTLIAQYPRWALLAWVAIAIGARTVPTMNIEWTSQVGAAVRVALIVGALAILARWLGLAQRIDRRAGFAFAGLADRQLERSAETVAGRRTVDSVKLQRTLWTHADLVDSIADDAVTGVITRSVLSATLAIDVRPRWRPTVRIAVIGWTALVISRLFLNSESVRSAFIVITAIAAMQLFGVVTMVHAAWKSRGPEECLIVLTPRWPEPRAVKRLFAMLLLTSQGVAWLTWIAIVIPAAAAGWIAWKLVAFAALCLFAASGAACGAMGLALSQRRTKDVSLGTIGLFLSAVVGAALFGWSPAGLSRAGTAGLAMILAPPVVGIVSLWWRPLQFPVQRADSA